MDSLRFQDMPEAQFKRVTKAELLAAYSHLFKHIEASQRMIDKVVDVNKDNVNSPLVQMRVLGMHMLNICERLDKIIELLDSGNTQTREPVSQCVDEIKNVLKDGPKTLKQLQALITGFKANTVKIYLYELMKTQTVESYGEDREKLYRLL